MFAEVDRLLSILDWFCERRTYRGRPCLRYWSCPRSPTPATPVSAPYCEFDIPPAHPNYFSGYFLVVSHPVLVRESVSYFEPVMVRGRGWPTPLFSGTHDRVPRTTVESVGRYWYARPASPDTNLRREQRLYSDSHDQHVMHLIVFNIDKHPQLGPDKVSPKHDWFHFGMDLTMTYSWYPEPHAPGWSSCRFLIARTLISLHWHYQTNNPRPSSLPMLLWDELYLRFYFDQDPWVHCPDILLTGLYHALQCQCSLNLSFRWCRTCSRGRSSILRRYRWVSWMRKPYRP